VQTTLRINDAVYRRAKAAAAAQGMTMTRFIEQALTSQVSGSVAKASVDAGVEERNQWMEALLQRTAHFKIGKRPGRQEMNER